MSALSELFHTILHKLPFHSEGLLNDAKDLVTEVENDVKSLIDDGLAEVKSDVAALRTQVSSMAAGLVSAQQVSDQRQGSTPTTNPDNTPQG